MQAGGSDQWGNITAGIDLARRLRGVQLYGCTCPLLTKSDGSKMGKTESGTLWLSAEKTSPYHFYQYWINLDDADVGRCLRFFTDLGKDEIDAVLAEHQADPGRRVAQRRLAAELTRLVHGPEGLRIAERATEIFFGAEISDLSDSQLAGIFADVPSRQLPRGRLAGDGLPIIDALVEVGTVQEQGRGPANDHARRCVRKQPPRGRDRNATDHRQFGERIDNDLAFGEEELRSVAVRIDAIEAALLGRALAIRRNK